jgi:hypothetical protein
MHRSLGKSVHPSLLFLFSPGASILSCSTGGGSTKTFLFFLFLSLFFFPLASSSTHGRWRSGSQGPERRAAQQVMRTWQAGLGGVCSRRAEQRALSAARQALGRARDSGRPLRARADASAGGRRPRPERQAGVGRRRSGECAGGGPARVARSSGRRPRRAEAEAAEALGGGACVAGGARPARGRTRGAAQAARRAGRRTACVSAQALVAAKQSDGWCRSPGAWTVVARPMRKRVRQASGVAMAARQACAEAERAREVLEVGAGASNSQEQVWRGLRCGRARGRAMPEQNARTAQA